MRAVSLASLRMSPDVRSRLLRLAIPTVIQNLVSSSLHIVDNVMLGQLGEMEMAAVTQANRLTFLFQLTLFGLCSATSTFIAQFWGKRDMERIHQTHGLSLCVALGLVVLFMTAALAFPGAFMRRMLEDEQAIALGASYLSIVGVGYLFQALSQVFGTVQRSTENAKVPMVAVVAAILVNTMLNYIFIFGKFGCPAMGVRGAALATVIATVVESTIVIAAGIRLRLASRARPKALFSAQKPFIRQYFRITVPVVLNEALWSLGVSLYSVVYGHMGTGVVAAVSIFNTVEQIGVAFNRGVTYACAVLVGKRIGEGDKADAQRIAGQMMWVMLAVTACAGGVIALASGWLVTLFRVSDATRAAACGLLRLCALFMPMNGVACLFIVGILRAGGDAKVSLVLDVGTVWLIGVPLVALAGLVLHWPLITVYLCAQTEQIAKIAGSYMRYRSKKWIHDLARQSK